MPNRLSQIETSLHHLYKQLADQQEALVIAAPGDTERIQQQIDYLKRRKIEPLEAEHRDILKRASEQLQISEPDAEAVLAEIVEGVTELETQPLNPEFGEMLEILRELRDKAKEPGKSAALKVKGMISPLPPFIGIAIEPEIDTEAFWQRNFPTFTRLIKGAAKK